MLRTRGPAITGRAMPFTGGGPLMSGILPAGGPALELLKREADRLVEQQQATQQNAAALQERVEEREQQCSRLETQIIQIQAENARLRSANKDGEKKLKEVNEEFKIIQDRHDWLDAREQQLSKKAAEAESFACDLKKAFDARFAHVKEVDSRVELLKTTHIKLTTDLSEARQQLDTSRKDVFELQQQKQALQGELGVTSASLQSVSLEREQAAVLQADLQEQITSQAAEMTKLQNDQEVLDVSLATTNSALADATKQLADSQAALKEAERRATEAAAGAERAIKEAHSSANAQIDSWKEHVAQEIAEAKSKAKAEVETMQSKMAAAQAAAEEELEVLKKTHSAALKSQQESALQEKQATMLQLAKVQSDLEARGKELAAAQEAAHNEAAALTEKNEAAAIVKAAHEEEVSGLKKQAAEEQEKQDKALADLRSDLEQQLTRRAEEMAHLRGELLAAVAHANELETAIEGLQNQMHNGENKVAHLEAALETAEEELTKKEFLLTQIGMAAHNATEAGERTGPSPGKNARRTSHEYQNKDSEQGPPSTKRKGRPTSKRFRSSPHKVTQHGGRHKLAPDSDSSDDTMPGDDDSEATSDADSEDAQSPKRRCAVVPISRKVYKEDSQLERRAATLRGRKSVFATMSTYTATDVDEAPDVQHRLPGSRRRTAAASNAPGAKHKATKKTGKSTKDVAKKRKSHSPPKKGSAALNLFGNTDPYAFAPSPY